MVNIEEFKLWPTNILSMQIPELAVHNEELASSGYKFYKHNFKQKGIFGERINAESFFVTHKSAATAALFSAKQEAVKMYLQKFYKDAVDWNDLQFTYSTFVNVQEGRKKWSFPHNHSMGQLVVAYYPQVSIGDKESDGVGLPGALCFHDPRPVTPAWLNRKENRILTQTPKACSLYVFPTYLSHSTMPYFDDASLKVCVVSNVGFFPKADIYSGKMYSTEEILSHT